MLSIRSLRSADHALALTLNNTAVPAVNPHDTESFAALVGQADRCWVADEGGTLAGLLVVFGPGASYGSANYRWVSERYASFRYVDRIIVDAAYKRRGLGSQFYAALEAHAEAHHAERLLCEVNLLPPNPQSLAFHAAAGWRAAGDRNFGPEKAVRYFEKKLGD